MTTTTSISRLLAFLLPLSILLSQCQTPKIVEQTKVFSKEEQTNLTPDQAFQKLKDGNERFVTGKPIKYNYLSQMKSSAAKQAPFAVVLSCMDSRTSSEVVFNLGLGDIFSIRVAGNVIDPTLLASLEYGCNNAGAKVIVVEGHSHCGAVHAAIDAVNGNFTAPKGSNLPALVTCISPAITAVKTTTVEERTSKNEHFFEAVVESNVWETIKQIREQSKVLREMEANKQIKIVSAVYDLGTGKVTFYDK